MTEMTMFAGTEIVPDFRIRVNNKDITTDLAARLISLTHTDNRGFEADLLDLELDDADGMMELPNRGAVLWLALGWKGSPLVIKGEFTVDEIEHSGAPDRINVRARSADFRQTLNIKREQSWHKTTIGAVIKEIAARHKLTASASAEMAALEVDHIDQTNESDGAFLSRLAKIYGAIATVKFGELMFLRQGMGLGLGKSSSKPPAAAIIERSSGDQHRFSIVDRSAYTGVIASWLHTREPKPKKAVKVRRRRRKKTTKPTKTPEAKQGEYLIGSDENVLVLSRTYANKANAERAAKTNWSRIQRGVASFSINLAMGREDLYPELPIRVTGFKPPIDGAEWIITTVTNTLNKDSGFTTSLELEVKISELDME